MFLLPLRTIAHNNTPARRNLHMISERQVRGSVTDGVTQTELYFMCDISCKSCLQKHIFKLVKILPLLLIKCSSNFNSLPVFRNFE